MTNHRQLDCPVNNSQKTSNIASFISPKWKESIGIAPLYGKYMFSNIRAENETEWYKIPRKWSLLKYDSQFRQYVVPTDFQFLRGGRSNYWVWVVYEQAILTHWGRVTHICVGCVTIIGSYNGLSPGRRQAIIWTNAGILLIGPLGTNFSEIVIEIHTFSFKKMHLKMSSGKWRPFCLGLNVLKASRHHSSPSCNFTTCRQGCKVGYIDIWYPGVGSQNCLEAPTLCGAFWKKKST